LKEAGTKQKTRWGYVFAPFSSGRTDENDTDSFQRVSVMAGHEALVLRTGRLSGLRA
jgi:hypothetical protein